jgi:hypothetical protein
MMVPLTDNGASRQFDAVHHYAQHIDPTGSTRCRVPLSLVEGEDG